MQGMRGSRQYALADNMDPCATMRIIIEARRYLCLVALLGSLVSYPGWGNTVIRHMACDDAAASMAHTYFLDVLQLAVQVSGPQYGRSQLQPVNLPHYHARQLMAVNQYEVDVIWAVVDPARKSPLKAIEFDITRGLQGLRVLLISRTRLAHFSTIHSIVSLQQMLGGLGEDWPDTRRLRQHGFTVFTTGAYERLFAMTGRHRLAYVPRSVLEIDADLALYNQHALAIAPGHLLLYPAQVYFFVHPDNHVLARRLEEGLHRIHASGELDKLLKEHPAHQAMFARLRQEPWQLHHLMLQNERFAQSAAIPLLWLQQHL